LTAQSTGRFRLSGSGENGWKNLGEAPARVFSEGFRAPRGADDKRPQKRIARHARGAHSLFYALCAAAATEGAHILKSFSALWPLLSQLLSFCFRDKDSRLETPCAHALRRCAARSHAQRCRGGGQGRTAMRSLRVARAKISGTSPGMSGFNPKYAAAVLGPDLTLKWRAVRRDATRAGRRRSPHLSRPG
jgi:hypothetical protein